MNKVEEIVNARVPEWFRPFPLYPQFHLSDRERLEIAKQADAILAERLPK